MCIDTARNLFLSDSWNHRIRKVYISTGIITTYAGTGVSGYSGDGGPAISANLSKVNGICLDRLGNLYIGDDANGRIRKVDAATGIITTFAGSGITGYGGDGGNADTAKFYEIAAMSFDSSGNLFLIDQNSNRVRRIDAITHIITTVAGNGPACPVTSGGCGTFGGDGGPADSGYLHMPWGLCLDHAGNIYIGDAYNARVRKVGYGIITPTFVGGAIQPLNVCVSSSATSINSLLAITDVLTGATEKWKIASGPSHGTLGGFSTTSINTGGVITPTGLTYTPVSGYTGVDAFTIRILNGQDSTITTINVTVNPMPSTITGATTICIGTSTTLNATPTGGIWSSSAVPIAPVVYATGMVTGISNGATIITYSLAPGCIATTYVTVDSLPAPIMGTLNVCAGLTTGLIDSSFIGTWSSGNDSVATIDAGTGIVTGGSVYGIVDITYTLPTGCITTANVTVDPLPFSIIGPTIVCAGEIATLIDFGGGTWSSYDAFVATIDSSSGLVSGISPGTSTITFTAGGTGCITTTTVTVNPCILDVPVTAIADNFSISPNPTTTTLTITSTEKMAQLTITNLPGQTVYTQTYNTEKAEIDVSGFPAGLYFVKINGPDGYRGEVRKFVKE